MIPGVLALACAASIGAYALALGGRALAATEILVPVALVVLLVALVMRWPSLVPGVVVGLGSAYLLARIGHTAVDGWSAAVGTGLLATAELASWSIDADARIHEERRVRAWRIATLAGLLTVALLLDVLVVGAAALAAPTGLLLVALGVAAAVGSVALVLRLLRT